MVYWLKAVSTCLAVYLQTQPHSSISFVVIVCCGPSLEKTTVGEIVTVHQKLFDQVSPGMQQILEEYKCLYKLFWGSHLGEKTFTRGSMTRII